MQQQQFEPQQTTVDANQARRNTLRTTELEGHNEEKQNEEKQNEAERREDLKVSGAARQKAEEDRGELTTNRPAEEEIQREAYRKMLLAELKPQQRSIDQHLKVIALTRSEQESARPVSIDQLLAVLEQEAAKRKHNTRVLNAFFRVLGGIMVLLCLYLWISSGRFPWQIFQGLGSLVGMVGFVAGYSKTQKAATRQIAEFEDVRAIGPMIEVLSANDIDVNRIVVPALTRQLPHLQASDAHLLTTEQRAVLNQLLMIKFSALPVRIPNFYAGALKALQQVGDEKSLPVVEKLSHGEGVAAYYPELKAQAKETLPFLRQRVEQARASQTLLRASAAAEAAPDTLLRAAMPTGATDDPTQLLRADAQDHSA